MTILGEVYAIKYLVCDIEYSTVTMSDKAFSSYREASEYLINNKFIPFASFYEELKYSKIENYDEEEVIAEIIKLDIVK